MNQTQAIAALKKLFGKAAAWRRDEDAPVGEAREALAASLPALRDELAAAMAARDARRAELLRDPEYQRLVAAADAAYAAHRKAAGNYLRRRVTVGKCSGLFFEVKGEGDNWLDAIEKAKVAR